MQHLIVGAYPPPCFSIMTQDLNNNLIWFSQCTECTRSTWFTWFTWCKPQFNWCQRYINHISDMAYCSVPSSLDVIMLNHSFGNSQKTILKGDPYHWMEIFKLWLAQRSSAQYSWQRIKTSLDESLKAIFFFFFNAFNIVPLRAYFRLMCIAFANAVDELQSFMVILRAC